MTVEQFLAQPEVKALVPRFVEASRAKDKARSAERHRKKGHKEASEQAQADFEGVIGELTALSRRFRLGATEETAMLPRFIRTAFPGYGDRP